MTLPGDARKALEGYAARLPNLACASFLCSGSVVEFTIPQVVTLAQRSGNPLPPAPLFPVRASIFARAIAPQTAITVVQFSLVAELRQVLDRTLGERPLNLSLAFAREQRPCLFPPIEPLVDVNLHVAANFNLAWPSPCCGGGGLDPSDRGDNEGGEHTGRPPLLEPHLLQKNKTKCTT